MPNGPYIDNSVVGFDPVDNMRIQVDTYNRLSSVLNQPNKPMFTGTEPPILYNVFDNKQAQGPSATEKLNGISIIDAIDSKDPNIQAIGRQAMEEDMQKNVPSYKQHIGNTVETPYELGSKYIDKKFGFSALRDNEDYYYKNSYMDSTWFGRNIIQNPLRFLGRVALGAVAKTGEALGYMGSMIGAIGSNNYMEKMADNGFSRWFEKQEDWIKNDLIPVYKQAGFDEKGVFAKLGDWSFWNDSVADAGAFMASFVGQTLLTGALGEAAGLGRIGSLGINTASKLGKFGRGFDASVKFLTGAEDVTGVANHIFNTASESFFEAAGVYKETKQDLIDARNQGKNSFTDEQINTISSKRASHDFKGNMMALTLSNAFENKFLFQPIRRFIRGTGISQEANIGLTRVGVNEFTDDVEGSVAANIIKPRYAKGLNAEGNPNSTLLGKIFDYKNPQGRLAFYGARVIGAVGIEGLYEENVQLAMERLSRYGDYDGKSFGQALSATAAQLYKQTQDAFTKGKDKEAAESIVLGGLIGIAGTTLIAKMFGGDQFLQGERRTEINRATQAVERYNKLRREWLSLGDIYEKKDDGSYDIDPSTGGFKIDEAKVQAKASGLSDTLKRTITADQIHNPVTRKMVQDDLLSDFVHAASMAGMGKALLGRIQNAQFKTPEEIKALGFNPAEINTSPSQLYGDTKNLLDMHEQSYKSTVKRPGGVTAKEFAESEQERKYFLYKAKSWNLAAKNAADTIQAAITAKDVEDPYNIDNDAVVQLHNSAQIQLAKLNQYNDVVGKNGGFYKEFMQQKRQALKKQIDESREALKDKIDNGELQEHEGLLFSPGKSNTDNTIDIDNAIQHASSRNAADQWQYVDDKLSALNNGHNNFQEFKKFLDITANKDSEAEDKKPEANTVETAPDGTFTVISPEGEIVKENIPTKDEADKTATQTPIPVKEGEVPIDDIKALATKITSGVMPTAEELQLQNNFPEELEEELQKLKKAQETPPEVDTVSQLEIPVGEDEIVSIDKPLAYAYPSMTSKRDTVDLPGRQEQMSTDSYSIMRSDFIKEFIDGEFGKKYKLFIVKDVFPEVYKDTKVNGNPVSMHDGSGKNWVFVDPTIAGEVVMVYNQDGTPAKVGDFFKERHLDYSTQPVIFSFDNKVFFNELYSDRIAIKASKNKITPEAADEENQRLRKEADDARAQINSGAKDRIEVKMMHFTHGLHPSTILGSIQERFGDFKFDVAIPVVAGDKTGKTNGAVTGKPTSFKPGAVVATIGGKDFQVTTDKLTEYPDVLARVNFTLNHIYETEEAAKDVRDNFLSVIVGTNDKQFFTIDKEDEGFKINFRKAREEDLLLNLERVQVRAQGIISNDSISDNRLNVSVVALRDGFKNYISPTEEPDFLTKEDYYSFIKPKLKTYLKKVINQDGSLHMDPVNPYFSFVVMSPISVGNLQKNNFDRLKARILQLAASQSYDLTKITAGLDTELTKGNITEEQFNSLTELANSNIPTQQLDALDMIKQQLTEGTITPAAYNLAAMVIERNRAEKKAAQEPPLDVEAQKADIERRRQDELNRLLPSKVEDKINTFAVRDTSKPIVKIYFVPDYIGQQAWEYYNKNVYGDQSFTEIKRRVGFSFAQMNEYLPNWRTLLPEAKDINTKYDAELAAIAPKEKKSVADKYKNKDKVDVGQAIAGSTQSSTTEYKVMGKYLYVPETNKFIYTSSGNKIMAKTMPLVLQDMYKQFPYKTSPEGNSGFQKLEISDAWGKFTIYAPPTKVPGAELMTSETDFDINMVDVDVTVAKLSEENKNKVTEFLQRWCR